MTLLAKRGLDEASKEARMFFNDFVLQLHHQVTDERSIFDDHFSSEEYVQLRDLLVFLQSRCTNDFFPETK